MAKALRTMGALWIISYALFALASPAVAECCKEPGAQSQGVRLGRVAWRDAILDGGKFRNADLSHANISGTSLKELIFVVQTFKRLGLNDRI